MLIKEYRILLPLTVDEYRIAQLYMIQKKSRLDSHGKDSGVEIISNKPYTEGPGGNGQYTFKIYHIGSKIPAWIRSVLPTTALEAHEEAWNAYPITKTRYSTPVMERVCIEVETLYFNDAGTQENVFNLKPEELKQRVVDVMDFVKDPISSHDYCVEEDPKILRSEKTGRGPLADDWVEEYVKAGKPIMCAYKLCRVEFRYWGLQTRAERWIHDLALRGTMLRAHRQAWAWQDEWFGLTMKDIRKLEHEAALHLSAVMANVGDDEEEDSDTSSDDVYYDCPEGPLSGKPSMIRWSSELDLDINEDGGDSPPLTPATTSDAALLVIVFHGDFSPDKPADTKTTDIHAFRSTIETLVGRHYPQLKQRVFVQMVSCGRELTQSVSRLQGISASFPSLHPSLALLLPSATIQYNEAVEGTIERANEVYEEFLSSHPTFNGEVFVIGDTIGGLFLFEALTRQLAAPVSRHSSNVSSRTIPEADEEMISKSVNEFTFEHNGHTPSQCTVRPLRSFRYSSAPPSAPPIVQKKPSLISIDSINTDQFSHLWNQSRIKRVAPTRPGGSITNQLQSHLVFSPSTIFLLGCPLGLVLMHRQLSGIEIESLEGCQLFNIFYPLDPCGLRVEPVLNNQLTILPPANVPKYQRYPLGDGKSIKFDASIDSSNLWGNKRIDHLLYCPNAMMALPSQALPNILQASYWESCDVAAFVLRQFVRGEEVGVATLSASMSHIPLTIEPPPMHWKKKSSRFKVANLSPNHRANDVLVVNAGEQQISAKFCYGPMDLVTLSREPVSVYVCPQQGDWMCHGVYETDSHGRLHLSLANSLPCGIHSIKMVVHGDHSYLDAFLAVVPHDTRCVVFSVDGSLTASLSVTGRDPRVRPGAVDVVRYWHDQGLMIIYVTARPDMQQRTMSAWLSNHNFPHALLLFNPSFCTDPLKQKSLQMKHLVDMGIKIHAAYGSGKDVAVYVGAGVELERVVSVSSGRKRAGINIESYSAHLADLQSGGCSLSLATEREGGSLRIPTTHRNVQRTSSFTPRGGKFEHEKPEKR